jgi:acetylornithine deacetylase/succinyl-diaminopimelate desuccinylase-like protein
LTRRFRGSAPTATSGVPARSHQPNEQVSIRDLVDGVKAIALAIHA